MLGQITDMSHDVLARVQQRLEVVKLTESAAALKAGLSDSAIRNVRRALKNGKDAKFSARTLEALAPILETTAAWLIEGTGDADLSTKQQELNAGFADLRPDDQDQILALVRRLRREGS